MFSANPPVVERKSYQTPEWSGTPTVRFELEVNKAGVDVENIDISSLKKGSIIVGRQTTCDIVIAHPTSSREHCVIQFRRSTNQVYLFDLNSAHGTFLNKKRIEPGKYIEVLIGDIIQFGSSSRTYMLSGPEYLDEKCFIPLPSVPSAATQRTGLTKEVLLEKIRSQQEQDSKVTEDDSGEITSQETPKLTDTELFTEWLSLPDESLEDEPKVLGASFLHQIKTASTTTLSADQLVLKSLGKTDRQQKSAQKLQELQTRVENLTYKLSELDSNTSFNPRSKNVSDSSQSTLEKQQTLQRKLEEAERLLTEQRSSLFRSFIDRFSQATGSKRSKTSEDDSESVLFGAFSEKEGGNKRKLYAEDEETNDDFLTPQSTSKVSQSATLLFAQRFKSQGQTTAAKCPVNSSEDTSGSSQAVLGQNRTQNGITSQEAALISKHFTPLSLHNPSSQASIADRHTAMRIFRQIQMEAQTDENGTSDANDAHDANAHPSRRATSAQPDTLDQYISSIETMQSKPKSKSSHTNQVNELQDIVQIFQSLILERKKDELMALFRETKDSAYLTQAGMVQLVPRPSMTFNFQTQFQTQEEDSKLEQDKERETEREKEKETEKEKEKDTETSTSNPSKPLTKLQLIQQKMRQQNVKNQQLQIEREKLAQEAEASRLERKAKKAKKDSNLNDE